jgi:hypothetical protein
MRWKTFFGVGLVVVGVGVSAAAEGEKSPLGTWDRWLSWLRPVLGFVEAAPVGNGATVDPDGRPTSGTVLTQTSCENGATVDPDGRCPAH